MDEVIIRWRDLGTIERVENNERGVPNAALVNFGGVVATTEFIGVFDDTEEGSPLVRIPADLLRKAGLCIAEGNHLWATLSSPEITSSDTLVSDVEGVLYGPDSLEDYEAWGGK